MSGDGGARRAPLRGGAAAAHRPATRRGPVGGRPWRLPRATRLRLARARGRINKIIPARGRAAGRFVEVMRGCNFSVARAPLTRRGAALLMLGVAPRVLDVFAHYP